jgi:hypothetical protein
MRKRTRGAAHSAREVLAANEYYFGGRSMSAHDSEHAHHEPEDESIGIKVGIFFICVLVALYFIAL